MPFSGWEATQRALVFGGVFLVPLFAVLWLWYNTSGRTDGSRWYWRLVLSALVALTVPAVVLGAANLDATQQDLMQSLGWLAIACGSVALLGVIAYGVWGRPTEVAWAPEPELLEPDPMEAAGATTVVVPDTVAQPAAARPTAPTGAYLFAKAGPDQGQQFPLGDAVTIGRSSSCGIALQDSRVSGEHAQVKRAGASYVFLDLGSTNHSFLLVEGQEQQLRSAQTLVDGDEIRMGQTILKFIQVPGRGQR
jgi:hypothetical protein